MNRALSAGLAGTLTNQTRLDTIGNNLANANTIGFKQSRASFSDAYYQTLRSGAAASASSGGTNPVQLGSGNSLGTIQTLYTQGSVSSTSQALDAAIEGPGMFIVGDGTSQYYTRDGAFSMDDQHTLVAAHNGMRVQGWMATGGVVDTTQPVGDLQFPVGELAAGETTTSVNMTGNLQSDATVGTEVVSSIEVYDSLSSAHEMTVTMTKNAAANTYDVVLECEGVTTTAAQISFDANGVLSSGSPVSISFAPGNGASTPQTIAVDFSRVTQLARDADAVAQTQDGRPAAALMEVSIQENGLIQGSYSDGQQLTLGQVALASFANQGGLEQTGSNLFSAGSATGNVTIGAAGTGGRGKIVAQALEQSNVDLTESFVDMISTQRAFQASTRVISAADDMLEEVMRLAQ